MYLLSFMRSVPKCCRAYSSSNKLVDVKINDKSGIAVVSMQRAPVNALNLELLTGLSDTLNELNNIQCRAMILTSNRNNVFSAGFDITEMFKPDKERFTKFYTMFQEVWLQLYASPFPTVAAITGHSPAGGCVLASACEYRVMVQKYSIGLNETQLSIIPPDFVIDGMRNTISKRAAEVALTAGALFSADSAMKIGLIDEIANDNDDCLKKSEAFFKRFDKINAVARAFTKQTLRGADIQRLIKNRENDLKKFYTRVIDPEVQAGFQTYLENLKKPK